MTEINLIELLKDALSRLFIDYSLPNKNGVLQVVKVFTQFLPMPRGISLSNKLERVKDYSGEDYDANFPCIIIRHEGVLDSEERRLELSVHKIRLIFGIYDENQDCQGWRDIFNMMQKVKQEFYVHRFLGDKFRLLMPVNSKLLELDTWPIYFGEIEMTYETGRARMPADFVHKMRGEKYNGK